MYIFIQFVIFITQNLRITAPSVTVLIQSSDIDSWQGGDKTDTALKESYFFNLNEYDSYFHTFGYILQQVTGLQQKIWHHFGLSQHLEVKSMV